MRATQPPVLNPHMSRGGRNEEMGRKRTLKRNGAHNKGRLAQKSRRLIIKQNTVKRHGRLWRGTKRGKLREPYADKNRVKSIFSKKCIMRKQTEKEPNKSENNEADTASTQRLLRRR